MINQRFHLPFLQRNILVFFSNRIALLKPVSKQSVSNEIENLKGIVSTHIIQLNDAINKNKENFIENYLWNEGSKRTNKVAALRFLREFINQFDNIIHSKSISIENQEFTYHNVNDLIIKIDDHITHHFPNAYQSFLKDIGGVEAIVKQSYKLLVAQSKLIGVNDVVAPEQEIRVSI